MYINDVNTIEQSNFIQACFGKPVSQTPIWLMRQAGRYMKEYQDVRSKVGFLELCKSPALVSEVTVTAQEVLGVDAAILFADILLITETLGFNLTFEEKKGPQISNPLRSPSDLVRMKDANVNSSLGYVGEAVKLTRKNLNPAIPLIGFAGAPFTVASYSLEGGSSRNFENTKKLMRSDPETLGAFLKILTQNTLEYLEMQIQNGANAIQLFDSWVGILSDDEYQTHVFGHVAHIFKTLKNKYPQVPLLYFGVENTHLLDSMKNVGADVLGLDYHVNLSKTWQQLGVKAVQGNLDPTTLLCPPAVIERETKKILTSVKGKHGFIFNLGHGILPTTPVEHAKRLVELVHQHT